MVAWFKATYTVDRQALMVPRIVDPHNGFSSCGAIASEFALHPSSRLPHPPLIQLWPLPHR